MNKTWLLAFLVFMSFQLTAQRYKTIELKPITKQGWSYFYDMKKIGSPTTLQFPLMAIQDEQVDR
ncbi:MAG: hypothetical protein SH819_09615 [Cytophagales bacterium]|nr:hypothetical protein [Cytophagales bacterium]